MPVITVTGLIGSGAIEVGAQVARKLGIDYIDRMIMAEAAKKIGTTVAAVAERTERPPRLGDRVAGFVKTVLERSALAGGGADPYFGGGLDALLVREYRDFPSEESEGDESLSDENLLTVTSAVIKEIATSGNVVIAGRGANIILRDDPGTLHVGLVSVHAERLKRIMERENLNDVEAERHVLENDRARVAYYKRFFKVDPEDPQYYHQVLNTDLLTIDRTADVIVDTAKLIGQRERTNGE